MLEHKSGKHFIVWKFFFTKNRKKLHLAMKTTDNPG